AQVWVAPRRGEHGERSVPPSRIVGETCQSWTADAEARGATVAALLVRTAAGGPADPRVSRQHREPAGPVSGGRRGARAGAVGSLRRDRTSAGLPVWELSVALGQGRDDVTPASVWRQVHSRGPLRRVGCRARGGARRPVCPGLPGATAWFVVSRPVGRQRRANAAEHAGLELPHHLADILQLSRARPVRAHLL